MSSRPTTSNAVALTSAAVVLAMVGVVAVQLVARNAGLSLLWSAGLAVLIGTGGTAWFIRGVARIRVPLGDLRLPIIALAGVMGVGLAVFGGGALELMRHVSPWAAERLMHVQAQYNAILQPDQPALIPAVLLCIAVAPAVCEEALFRGVIRELLDEALPAVRVLTVGALFAVVHGEPTIMLPLFYVGCMLTILADRTGGWGAAAVAHLTLNATNGVVAPRLFADHATTLMESAALVWVGAIIATLAMSRILKLVSQTPIEPAPTANSEATEQDEIV